MAVTGPAGQMELKRLLQAVVAVSEKAAALARAVRCVSAVMERLSTEID